MAAQVKVCTACHQAHPAGDFPVRKGRPLRRCRACERTRLAAWKAAHPDKAAQYRATREHKAKTDPETRAHLSKQRKRARLKSRYGLTPSGFLGFYKEQAGLCAICGGPPGKQGLHVDHDHATGRVRGLLCFDCNSGLGKFRDHVGLLLRAVTYLVDR